jgi:protein-disulfide isomerase-like protein with CxxC motif
MDAPALRLDYFFDPFCGWCYASAPALKAVVEAFPEALTMHLTEDRMRRTLARMRELSGTGVPQLLATVGDHHEVIRDGGLYGGAETVLGAIKAVTDRAFPIQ